MIISLLRLATAAAVLLQASAPAQEIDPEAGPVWTAVVPVVGTVPGALGAIWRTEISVHNTTGADIFVAVTLLSDPEQSLYSTFLAAGQSVSFGDVSQDAFGKSGILSPLLIRNDGPRSVFVSAVVYAVQGERVSEPLAIPVIYGEPQRRVFILGPLTFNEQFRTNVGIVNLGDSPASFTISVQRIPGRNLAVDRVTLPPRSLIHSPLPALFPLLNEGSGLTVLVDPSAANTYAYAAMIRNADNQARFFAPR